MLRICMWHEYILNDLNRGNKQLEVMVARALV